MTWYNLLILAVFTSVLGNISQNPFLTDEYINEINNKQSLWRAGRNFDPNTPISHLRNLLGVNSDISKERVITAERIHHVKEDDIPESFDAREQWPNCPTLAAINDQSACASSWALVPTTVMSDRICVLSNATLNVPISTKYVLSCCTGCGMGCSGGFPDTIFTFWALYGIPTGGLYNTSSGCQNYPFAPCQHLGVNSSDKPACPMLNYDTPECVLDACDSNDQPFGLTFGKSFYKFQGEEQMQLEIMKYGSLAANILMWADIFNYKSGVYKRTTNDYVSKHAVRIIGWGVENDNKYWLITNTWNEDWGDNGMLKILRGVNEVGIEDEIYSGLPM